MSYSHYLKRWRQTFGNARAGESGYWQASRWRPLIISKLTFDELALAEAAMSALGELFDRALEADDDEAMELVLKALLPYEIELLV